MIHKQTFTRFFLGFLITTGLLLAYSVSAPAISLKEFFGFGSDETEQAQEKNSDHKQSKIITQESAAKAVDANEENGSVKPDQTSTAQALKAQLALSDLQKTISVLDETQRKKILADEQIFSEFVKQEATNASVLVAAMANNVDKSEKTQIIVQRGVDNIVRELYLNQLLASKIPAGFPNDKQIQEYFDANNEKFVIEERIHVWQIFLPVTENSSQKDIELLKKQAESISNDLQKNKIDFAIAASKFSRHEASRLNGGYMGLINISDMKPEIKTTIQSLKPDVISKPIKTEDGIHILKRGAIVPEQELTLEQLKPKIKEVMVQQLKTQIRQAIFKQASITYPIDINDKKIEEWRLKLRTN